MTTMVTEQAINVPLMHRTLEHIEAHPEELNQVTWHCGTRYCFAGHAAILAGAVFVTTPYDPDPDNTTYVLGPDDDYPILVGDYAARVLGIDPGSDDADELFSACNTLDDLRRVVVDLTAQAKS